MKRELDSFHELVKLEALLEKWPRARPLLEKALRLYERTNQLSKCEAIRKRLEVAARCVCYCSGDEIH